MYKKWGLAIAICSILHLVVALSFFAFWNYWIKVDIVISLPVDVVSILFISYISAGFVPNTWKAHVDVHRRGYGFPDVNGFFLVYALIDLVAIFASNAIGSRIFSLTERDIFSVSSIGISIMLLMWGGIRQAMILRDR